MPTFGSSLKINPPKAIYPSIVRNKQLGINFKYMQPAQHIYSQFVVSTLQQREREREREDIYIYDRWKLWISASYLL